MSGTFLHLFHHLDFLAEVFHRTIDLGFLSTQILSYFDLRQSVVIVVTSCKYLELITGALLFLR